MPHCDELLSWSFDDVRHSSPAKSLAAATATPAGRHDPTTAAAAAAEAMMVAWRCASRSRSLVERGRCCLSQSVAFGFFHAAPQRGRAGPVKVAVSD